MNTSPSTRSCFAWWSFGLCALCYMIAQFHRILPASMGAAWQTSFALNQETMGVLASRYFLVYAILQIPTGIIVDKVAPKWVIAFGVLVAGIGAWLMAIAPTIAFALWGRTVVGVGVAVIFIAVLKLVALIFSPKQFASLVGLMVMLGNLGAMLATTPVEWLLQQYSWRVILQAIACVSVVLSVACVLTLSGRRYQSQAAVAEAAHSTVWQGVWQTLRNRLTWAPLLVCAGIAGSYLAFVGMWLVPLLMHQGMRAAMASAHNMMALFGFALGSLVIGGLSDRWQQRRRPVLIFGAVYVLTWLPILAGLPLAGFLGFVLCWLMGFSVASFTLTWSIAKEVNAAHLSGTATSLVNAGAFLVVAILQPVFGVLVDVYGVASNQGYAYGVCLLFVVACLGYMGAWFLQPDPSRP